MRATARSAFRRQPANEFARGHALAIDTSVYAERENGIWCVFGEDTGFCYDQCSTQAEAEQEALRMNKTCLRAAFSAAVTRLIATA